MTDPRYIRLAKLLIRYSTTLRKGDRVLIDATEIPDEMVIELIRARTPGAKVWLPKFYDQIMQTQSSVPLAIRETAFDDPLTVVRSDTPQAARRSTQR